MHRFLFTLIISSCLLSCNDLTNRNQEWIIGEWSPVEDDVTEIKLNNDLDYWYMKDYNMTGYHFMEDGMCENKIGYYEYYDPQDPLSFPYRKYHIDKTRYGRARWLDNIIRFLGHKTNYRIEDNKLKIYDLSSEAWDTKHISFLSKDTMLLSSNDSISEKYVRKTYEIENEPLFDQIIFYSPDTYFAGSRYFSLQRDGSFICSGCFTGRIDDIFVGKMVNGEFEHMEMLFKKANICNVLDEVYSLSIKDLNAGARFDLLNSYSRFCPNVSFVSKNKLYTIEYPLGDMFFENKEFAWAYFAGLFIPERVHFIPETLNKQEKLFSEFNSFHSLTIEKQDSIIDLQYIECFYLSILLSQAKISNEKFQPIYIIKESLESQEEIETNGQYFSYMKNGEKITLDVGFNVFKENSLDKLFRKKTYGEWLNSNGMEYIPKRLK